MKKSNIILLAFGLFLVGGMLTLYIDSVQHHNQTNQGTSMTKKVDLPAFSVIVAEKGSDLHIQQSDSNLLAIEYFKDNKIPSKLYTLSGDTLHVYAGLRLFVKCRNLHSVIGNSHKWVGINRFDAEVLHVKMHGGELNINNEVNFAKQPVDDQASSYTELDIVGKDEAQINISNTVIKNLKINLDNAKVWSDSRATSFDARLVNHSRLDMVANYGTLHIEKDSTCTNSSWN